VIDSETGSPVPNAVLEYGWTVYDYPMLDGGGSYEIKAYTAADEKGRFTLTVPSHRRGLFSTSMYPPQLRPNGYQPFTMSDWDEAVRHQSESDGVIIRLKPLRPGDVD